MLFGFALDTEANMTTVQQPITSDHEDDEAGYWHYTISVPATFDQEAFIDDILDVISDYEKRHKVDINFSGRRHVCLFSEGDTRHVWDGRLVVGADA